MFSRSRWAVYLILSFALVKAHASPFPTGVKTSFACKKQVEAKLQKFFPKDQPQWRKVLGPAYDVTAFRSPTENVGEWIEMHVPDKGTPDFTFVSAKANVYHSWNAKNCKAKEVKEKGFTFFTPEKNPQGELFTDKSLANLLAGNKKGLIYIWSPRMVYSVTEFRNFRDVAKKKGWEFIALLDPQVSDSDAKAAASKYQLEYQGRRLASVDLYMREGLLHYPSVYVYNNGKLHPDRLIGVLTQKDLGDLAEQKMGELK